MKEYQVILPMVNNIPLLNAIGENETEASVNLSLLDLTEEEHKEVKFLPATIKVNTEENP